MSPRTNVRGLSKGFSKVKALHPQQRFSRVLALLRFLIPLRYLRNDNERASGYNDTGMAWCRLELQHGSTPSAVSPKEAIHPNLGHRPWWLRAVNRGEMA